MKAPLESFIKWLESDLTHFVSLVEEGSTVTDDTWQEGYSDFDMTIIVTTDEDKEVAAVYEWLKHNPFPDQYLFGPRLAHEFIHGSTLNDLSMKFRARTIAGIDLVSQKDEPDRETAVQIGTEGLKSAEIRYKRRLLNLAHWSQEHCQKANYPLFKDFFVLLAARIYGQTGRYPIARADVAAAIESDFSIVPLLEVTNNISQASKDEQLIALKTAIDFIRALPD